MSKFMPMSDPSLKDKRPRLTKEAMEARMEDVATCANVDPLRLTREIAHAWMDGVNATVLARWFGVSYGTMAGLINMQILGGQEFERIMKADRAAERKAKQ